MHANSMSLRERIDLLTHARPAHTHGKSEEEVVRASHLPAFARRAAAAGAVDGRTYDKWRIRRHTCVLCGPLCTYFTHTAHRGAVFQHSSLLIISRVRGIHAHRFSERVPTLRLSVLAMAPFRQLRFPLRGPRYAIILVYYYTITI